MGSYIAAAAAGHTICNKAVFHDEWNGAIIDIANLHLHREKIMITEAGWIVIVTIICGCVTTVVGMLTRRDVNTLRPQLMTVAEQLVEANKLILSQGNIIQGLHDEIAMRKPTMTTQRFEKDYEANPPYKKPDK